MSTSYTCTVKPVNKGHPRERQNMVFIDKWSLLGGFIKEGLLQGGLYLQGCLYSDVALIQVGLYIITFILEIV